MDEELNLDFFLTPRPVEVAEGMPPRGLLDDGLVRTTGWLQLGDRPISSKAVSAVIFLLHGLAIAVPLAPANPVLAGLAVLVLPPCGWALWHLVTARLLPASRARNIDTVQVRQLTPNGWVRLHGSIGPVGRVSSVTPEDAGEFTVRFSGGIRRSLPADHQLHVVELLD